MHKQVNEALGAHSERRRAVWKAVDALNAREVQRLLRQAYEQADTDHRRRTIRRTATYLRCNFDGILAWRRYEGVLARLQCGRSPAPRLCGPAEQSPHGMEPRRGADHGSVASVASQRRLRPCALLARETPTALENVIPMAPETT